MAEPAVAVAAAPVAAPTANGDNSSSSSSVTSPNTAATTDTQQPTQTWTLFVGQIPNDVNEDTLKQLFSAYGLVTESKILMDKVAQKSRGCAFITFASQLGAETAIATLHERFSLPGSSRPLIVRYSTKQLASADKSADPGPFKLYISNLSRQTTEADVRALFSPFGALIDDVVILREQSTGISRGVAFVRYERRSEAAAAIQALHEQLKDKDAPHLMQVKYAHTASEKKMMLHRQMGGAPGPAPMMGPGGGMGNGAAAAAVQAAAAAAAAMHGAPGAHMGAYYPAQAYPGAPYPGAAFYPAFPPHMGGYAAYGANGGAGGMHAHGGGHHHRSPVTKGPEGANLFIYGIPESYGDADLSALFASFGSVINAKVYRDLATGKSKAFGFVSFDSPAPAAKAVAAMDGYLVAGKKLTVKLKTENTNNGNGNSNGNGTSTHGQNGHQQQQQQYASNGQPQQQMYAAAAHLSQQQQRQLAAQQYQQAHQAQQQQQCNGQPTQSNAPSQPQQQQHSPQRNGNGNGAAY